MKTSVEMPENTDLYQFTDEGNSCQILDPATPRHWYNYLWNEDRYCAQISQTGHGRSYFLSEKADMCMINQNDARYVYLRDDESGSCWNIGKGPLNAEHQLFRNTIRKRWNRRFLENFCSPKGTL